MRGYRCHDLKEDLMGTKFLIIFVKYVVYDWGLGAQALHMTDSKLHLFLIVIRVVQSTLMN